MSMLKKVVLPKFVICFALVGALFTTSCDPFMAYQIYEWAHGDGGGDDGEGANSYSPTTPAIEATETYAIAIGGVAPGRDELILNDKNGKLIDFAGHKLDFKADSSAVSFQPRPTFEDFTSGSGAKIIPQNVGVATISYTLDDVEQSDKFTAIVPPQSLIQMMVAEANQQLTEEAQLENSNHVKLTSVSPTATAIGAVTRNRILRTDAGPDYSLFGVDETMWLKNPPDSYFEAVITAAINGIYQYSPVDPSDPNNKTYTNAEARQFLEPNDHRAYDQAVISAAHIFTDETVDPTNGAFGFFSPTIDEWVVIKLAQDNNMIILPPNCGMSDDDFPEFAPIQLLILPNVWKYADGRPSFIFIRTKEITDPAVTETP